MRQTLCNHCKTWYESREGFCKKCFEEIPEDEQKKTFNISVYKAYNSKDFDGTLRRVTSTREENQLLNRFGLVRHEDFKKQFPVSKQMQNIKELQEEKGKKREGISMGTISEDEFNRQTQKGRVSAA